MLKAISLVFIFSANNSPAQKRPSFEGRVRGNRTRESETICILDMPRLSVIYIKHPEILSSQSVTLQWLFIL